MQPVSLGEFRVLADVRINLVWILVARPFLYFLNVVLRVAERRLPVILVQVRVIFLGQGT